MKSKEQVIRYVSHCRFDDSEWDKVLEFCRVQYGGGNIHKTKSFISDSTFDQFMEWVESGYGAGDIVRYGHTMGIVGSSTPESTYLSAYCDFEGNLIAKRMEVPAYKLLPLDPEEIKNFERLMYESGLDFVVRTGTVSELYLPEPNSYVCIDYMSKDSGAVGFYSHSDSDCIYFGALLCNGRFHVDAMMERKCATIRMRPANEKSVLKLHRAASVAGYVFNSRTNEFTKCSSRGKGNVYWYINDRWSVIADKDNGSAKHSERFDSGNYFTDYTEALLFLQSIVKTRKGEN